MEQKIQKIQHLIRTASDTYDFGGGEDEDGCLHRGDVDFEELEERIICVLRDKEWVPPKPYSPPLPPPPIQPGPPLWLTLEEMEANDPRHK